MGEIRHKRARSLLLSALVLSSASGPTSRSWAQQQQQQRSQQSCGSAKPLRVDNPAGALALMAAVDCANGGAVEVVWAGPITLDAPISVGAGTYLSITGENDLAEAHGGFRTRLFDVAPSGSLALTGLKLSGGSAQSGGAIYSSGAALTLAGCVVDGNNATAGDGGAVLAEGGELTIIGGEFARNNASKNGGAVLAIDAQVVIRDGTVFEENWALREGGALYCGGSNATDLGEASAAAASSCSLSGAVFRANVANLTYEVKLEIVEDWYDLYGGGAAAFWFSTVDITDSKFEFNYAQISGGAVFGGNSTVMAIDGCTFRNNTTTGFGAAIAVSSATLEGGTLLVNNTAIDGSGGAVFGWDGHGEVVLDDVLCTLNKAKNNAGCFYSAGTAVVNEGAVMTGNVAEQGGCIYAASTCFMKVYGGEYTGNRVTGNGAFMYATDGATVTITGGTVTKNVAERRAGGVYCSGDSKEYGGSRVTIEGGTFSENEALELGGVIAARGTTTHGENPTVVNITGGTFSNNTAKYYGGFIFLEQRASLSCQGAVVTNNSVSDQGGGIYARDAIWVASSCDLIGNSAPQGAAAYLTYVDNATLENHEVSDNIASSGSVLYVTQSTVGARGINFQSAIGLQEDSSNRAIQIEDGATLLAEDCTFGGWMGDSVIYNANPEAGSLTLDSCDFSETAVMVVASPHSDAEIRNAVVGHRTHGNTFLLEGNTPILVDRVVGCEDPGVCGPGQCVDSVLGVLCECLEPGVCLDGGGALSIGVNKPPETVTYHPDPVYFELVVSAAAHGTTSAIWNLTAEADDLELQPFPYSGVLRPGGSVIVAVTGNPRRPDVGGNMLSRFLVTSVGSGTSDSTTGVEVEVESVFYFCRAFEYAMPVDGDADGGVTCEQCASVDGADGLDCRQPGATLASMPVLPGYWRSGPESLVVHACLHSAACSGATQVSSSKDYCANGYQGPYCAVCTEGYGQGVAHACHSCTGTRSRLLIFTGSVFALLVLLLLFLAFVFLIGGLDAVDSVRRSLAQTLSISSKPQQTLSGREGGNREITRARPSPRSTIGGSPGATVAPVSTNVNISDGEDEGGGESKGNGARPALRGAFCASTSELPSAGGRAFLLNAGMQLSDSGRVASGTGVASRPACCGVGDKIKRWAARLPMDKLKILVVVWQILTVFPSITGVQFPASYARFLSWVDVVNLDMGHIFSASCFLPKVNFYQRLLLTTLSPIGLAGVLVLTYWMAKRRAGIGSAGVAARKAAWSRHMAAGLLLTFLVFTSTSTMAFKTFPCDDEAVDGESYLRADYSLSCKANKHTWYQVYAGVMIVVYPVGIPLLYAYILWVNRVSLNPVGHEDFGQELGRGTAGNPTTRGMSEEMREKLRRRRQNPDLVPSMFLWKDFGPDMYYYEVIECGRRILLTGLLIFFVPGTASQAAMSCIFAFVSLLGFELLRPHLDPADSWLYRLGCVVIFLSNFLALLIQVDAAGEGKRAALGGILVAINICLVFAVLAASWVTTQQMVDDNEEGESSFSVAKTMLTFEQRAAETARLARRSGGDASEGRAPISSASSSFGVATLVGGGGEGGEEVSTHSEGRGGSVSATAAEALWQEGKSRDTPRG